MLTDFDFPTRGLRTADLIPWPTTRQQRRALRRRRMVWTATDVLENGLLSLIFENGNYANVGDATGLRGSSTAGVFYIGLSTGTLVDASAQNTTEAAYTTYGRVSVARSTAGWTVTSGVVSNDNAITFGACTAGSSTVTYFGIGSDSTGAGNLFLWGALTAPLAISAGITPSFASGALTVSLDLWWWVAPAIGLLSMLACMGGMA